MIPIQQIDLKYIKKRDTVYRCSNYGRLSRELKSYERIIELDKKINNETMHIYHIKYQDKDETFNDFKQFYCINIKNFNTDFISMDECSLTIYTEIKIFFRKLIEEIKCKIKY